MPTTDQSVELDRTIRSARREKDFRRQEQGTAAPITGIPGAPLEEQPEELRSMFNGVHRAQADVRPSRDTGAPELRADTAQVREGHAAAVPLDGVAYEDLNRSRDSKVGGLVSPPTKRELSVDEAQAQNPESPQGGVTLQQDLPGEDELGAPNAGPKSASPVVGGPKAASQESGRKTDSKPKSGG